MFGTANKLMQRFTVLKFNKCEEVAKRMQTQLSAFKPNLAIIRALCNPGLKERHLTKMREVLGS